MSEVNHMELAQRAVRGDQSAAEEIYRLYKGTVLMAVGTLVPPCDRDDMVQDVFTKVFEKLATFQGTSQLNTWVFRVARNEALQRARSRQYQSDNAALSMDEGFDTDEGETIYPLQPICEDTHLKWYADIPKLRASIARLPPTYRKVFEARMADKNLKEIAKECGISLTATKTRIIRGTNLLRAMIMDTPMIEANDANAARNTPQFHGQNGPEPLAIDTARAMELRSEGKSWDETARVLGVAMHRVYHACRKLDRGREHSAVRQRVAAPTQREAPRPAETNGIERASAITLTLRSGGTLRVELNCHLFAMKREDRDFVFQVVDLLHSYEGAQ